jgi:hypothetical protein
MPGEGRMWEFFGKVVDSLPPWFLMALIVFLLAAALYLLPRVRRDTRGRFYLFSRSYEYQKNRMKEQTEMTRDVCARIDALSDKVNAVDRRMSSVECEDLKQTFYIVNEAFPKAERLIAGLKYIYNGRNGKVREDVARFVKDNPDVYMSVISTYPQWALAKKE